MMHYKKGDNIEKELTKEDLPFDDCLPNGKKDFLWMHVKGGTKLNNVVSYAKHALEKGEYRTVVWSGVGGGIVKTISCAEIIKRSVPLYQVTRMAYTNVEEHWLPQMAGLEEIVANREIPCLHILMSLDAIDDSVSGLQKPGTKTEFYNDTSVAPSSQQKRKQQRYTGGNKNQQQARPQQQRQNNNNDNGNSSNSRPHKRPQMRVANADQAQGNQTLPGDSQKQEQQSRGEPAHSASNSQKRHRHKKRPNQTQQSSRQQGEGQSNNNNAAAPTTLASPTAMDT